MSDPARPDKSRPSRPPELPQPGEILREIERLKQEPVRFGCFGMSFGMALVVLALAWLIWLLLR